MTDVRRSPIVGAVVALVILFAAAVWLQMLRDKWYQLTPSEEETLYLTQRATSRVVFSQRSLASDLYWIRAIQYYGGRARGAKAKVEDAFEPPAALAANAPVAFDLLYPLLDITTTLDPRFNIAYRFGSIFLSEKYPHGPGRPDQAIALLEKALQAMPDKWQYWQDIGFVYYWNIHDYAQAARAFNKRRRHPRCALVAPLVGGDDARQRRRSRRVAAVVDAAVQHREQRLRAQRREVETSAARRDRNDRGAAACDRCVLHTHGIAGHRLEDPRSPPVSSAAFRSIRVAFRTN